jgi:dihydropyrimidinase
MQKLFKKSTNIALS